MTTFTKLVLASLIPVSAGIAIPLAIRNFNSNLGSSNKYSWQASPSLSLPLLTSKESDPRIKIFLELDSEHERFLERCKTCNRFQKRFKLRVDDKNGKGKNYDWMEVSSDGKTSVIVSEDYKSRPKKKESEVELSQKLKMSDSGNNGGSILLDLKNIDLETSNCRWNSEKKIECDLDFSDWTRVKLGENAKPKVAFWARS